MSRYSIWIVSPPNYLHSHAFDEVAIGLHAGFRALGLDAEVVHDSSRLGDVTIVLGCNLLKGVAPPPPDKRLILFNLEQITPNSPWLTQDYLALLGRYPVWDYSQGNIAELARMGIKAQHCGIGYAPELTCIAPVAGRHRRAVRRLGERAAADRAEATRGAGHQCRCAVQSLRTPNATPSSRAPGSS